MLITKQVRKSAQLSLILYEANPRHRATTSRKPSGTENVVDMIILLHSHAQMESKSLLKCLLSSPKGDPSTYDHRLVRTGHPVRSAILKHQIGRLVVEWVTISKYLLLYVFCFSFLTLYNVIVVEVVEFLSLTW